MSAEHVYYKCSSSNPGRGLEESNTSAKDHSKSVKGLDQKPGLEEKIQLANKHREPAGLSDNERKKGKN